VSQLARYVAAHHVVPASAYDSDATDIDVAASRAVVHATGGARYTAHRDGLPSAASATVSMLLTSPSVCMREVTMIVYLTADDAYPRPLPPAASPAAAVLPHATTPQSAAAPSYRVVPLSECPHALRPGALVLYVGADPSDDVGSTASHVLEILPVGGRAVLFDSRTILHEVRPMTVPDVERLAMTVWVGGAYDLSGLGHQLCSWSRRFWALDDQGN